MNEMKNAETKLLEIYYLLSQEVYNSSWYFSIAKELSIKFKKGKITEGKRLLAFSYFACLRETFLSLSRVYFEDQDSITFQYLKSHLVNNRKNFSFIHEEDINTIEKEIDLLLERQDPLFIKIKTLRDKSLSHLDKKNINDPKVIVPVPIEFDEITNCIKDFSTLMKKFPEIDGRFHYPNVNPSQIIQQELESILGK